MKIHKTRYLIQWVTPFGRYVVHRAGAGDNTEYIYRRARGLSQGWKDCFVRVVDTEPIPNEIRVFQYGKEIFRDETAPKES